MGIHVGRVRVVCRPNRVGRPGDGDVTALTDDVRRQGNSWRIINISFGGVSGSDTQCAEFEVFLRDGGATLLSEKLDELIRSIERDAS